MSSPLIPIFDGHNDTLLRLIRAEPDENDSFFRGGRGHIDLARAQAGGLSGGFCAVYVPSDPSVPYAYVPGELPPVLDLAYTQRFRRR